MNKFSVAAAQSSSIRGNVQRNIDEHLTFIQTAADNKVSMIVFPELSLTGYEPDLAQELALDQNDNLLSKFMNASNKLDITIIAGCPIRSNYSKPYIGAFIIHPDKPVEVYRKRYLHPGEERYFMSSNDNLVCSLKGESVGIAICADINNPAHPADARKSGATMYAAGVFMTPTGIDEATTNMANYSSQYNMHTVMANYATDSGGYTAAGKSAIWDNSGELVVMAKETENALVIATREYGKWKGTIIKV